MERGKVQTYYSDFLGRYAMQTYKWFPTFRNFSNVNFIIN